MKTREGRDTVQLKKIKEEKQIPLEYRDTPIGELIRYQNLMGDFKTYDSAQLLVGMCMDNRKQLRIPENFAYIIRTGGANLRYSEFKVSYAIAIGNVGHIAIIAHDNCGMVNLVSKREQFIEGLSKNAGWERQRAEEHFMNYAPMFEIDNELDFVAREAKRLEEKYPGVMVAPLLYTIDDNMLSIITE
ncbi:MAG: carbonic anhydrase [Clostridia bacterium]|nr:carbonic anhydrase [Clostridia bacterium]